MDKKNRAVITKRQSQVLDDLFSGEMNEEEVIARHKLGMATYQKWMSQEHYVEQFEFRLQSARRHGQLIIAKFIPTAAYKLVKLTDSDKEETSRKACLDILSLPFENRSPEKENDTKMI